MFRSSPFDYDPYYYSGYPQRPAYVDPYYVQQQQYAQEQRARELAQRRQAAAQQRMRRAQYLPHEFYDDEDDMDIANHYPSALSPWDRLYLEKKRREEAVETQRQRELAALEARRRELSQQEEEYRAREEERREAMRQKHRGHLQNQRRRQPSPSHKIIIEDGSSPAAPHPVQAGQASSQPKSGRPTTPSSTPVNEAETPSPRAPSPQTLQAHIEAASKIQTAYRIHSAFKTLQTLSRQFETLKSGFSMPQFVDFQNPNGNGSLPVTIQPSDEDMDTSEDGEDSVIPPKLAFTSANYHLHAYTESLNRLLLKLDGVESWGDANVRKTRRRIVGNVEKEASRVEKIWRNAWKIYQKSLSENSNPTEMEVEPDPIVSQPEEIKGIEETITPRPTNIVVH